MAGLGVLSRRYEDVQLLQQLEHAQNRIAELGAPLDRPIGGQVIPPRRCQAVFEREPDRYVRTALPKAR